MPVIKDSSNTPDAVMLMSSLSMRKYSAKIYGDWCLQIRAPNSKGVFSGLDTVNADHAS